MRACVSQGIEFERPAHSANIGCSFRNSLSARSWSAYCSSASTWSSSCSSAVAPVSSRRRSTGADSGTAARLPGLAAAGSISCGGVAAASDEEPGSRARLRSGVESLLRVRLIGTRASAELYLRAIWYIAPPFGTNWLGDAGTDGSGGGGAGGVSSSSSESD